MRVLVIILAVAAAPVAAAILWTRAQPDPVPATSLQPRGIVWADRVFTQPAELRRWLRARGERYKVWAKHHPVQAATLEHRQLPPTRTAAPEPRADSGSGSRKNYGGIFGLIIGFGALVVLTLQFGRRVRVARPRVRLPALAVDVSPLANGVRRNLGRLGQAPEAIRAGRNRARATRREPALPSPVRSHGNGSKPRPVEVRSVARVSHAVEPSVVSQAVLEPELPPIEQATTVAGLPLVEELPEIEEPRVEELPQIEELPPIEEPEPPEVEEPRSQKPSQNGKHVAVRPELPPVEAPPPEDTSRVKEILEPPKRSKRSVLPKEGWDRCAVSCWRGYVNAHFYAHPAGETDAIATSPAFEWWAWQQAPKDAQAAQAALDELQRLLEAEGWEALGRGHLWYELRFQREPIAEW
jgi:hypothetical protein